VARSRCCDTRNTKERVNGEHKLRPKPAPVSDPTWERLGVKFPRATQQEKTFRTGDNSIARLFEGAAQEVIAADDLL
jgi:hypothetical protein